MPRSRVLLLLLALLIVAPAAYPTCTTPLAPGPSAMSSLVSDVYFQDDCELWVFDGGTVKQYPWADLYDIGTIVQEFEVPSDAPFWGTVEIQVLQQGNLHDKLFVELVDASGTIVETLATFTRSSASGNYDFEPANNYDGQTIKLRLRYQRGPFGGGTIFRVKEAFFWIFNT